MHNETTLVAWDAPEFHHAPKTKKWYAALVVLALSLIAITLYFKNYLTTFLTTLGFGLVTLMANKEPDTIEVSISEFGIKTGAEYYAFSALDAFWIQTRKDGSQDLLVHGTGRLSHIERIPLDPEEIDPLLIREILIEYIDEIELKEPFMYRIAHWVGFH